MYFPPGPINFRTKRPADSSLPAGVNRLIYSIFTATLLPLILVVVGNHPHQMHHGLIHRGWDSQGAALPDNSAVDGVNLRLSSIMDVLAHGNIVTLIIIGSMDIGPGLVIIQRNSSGLGDCTTLGANLID